MNSCLQSLVGHNGLPEPKVKIDFCGISSWVSVGGVINAPSGGDMDWRVVLNEIEKAKSVFKYKVDEYSKKVGSNRLYKKQLHMIYSIIKLRFSAYKFFTFLMLYENEHICTKIITKYEVNYHYLERGGGSISLTLKSLKSNIILSALKYIIGPEFVTI